MQQNSMVNTMASKFETEYTKALKEEYFPKEFIEAFWLHDALKALEFASPLSLGIMPAEMVEIFSIRPSQPINLYQFAILSNNLETRTMKEMKMTAVEYCEMITMAGKMSKKWNEIVKAIRDSLMQRIQEEQTELNQVAELQSKSGLKTLPQA